MTHLAPDFGDVSSIIRLRSRPEESPEKRCLATVELKTKILQGVRGEQERELRRGGHRGKK